MPVIGIDLGTTNSLVAYWTKNGPKIIPNVLGSNLTPSVVSVGENGGIFVGQVAKERLITYPNMTAAAFKRYMGTEKTYQLGKYSFTPEELSSFVVRALKADAEAYFNEEVNEAIISVPAYFNDMQRKATKRAAELAGLKVERLISEPTAAAISYGLHQEKSETKFLIFDLGGGTFDVSILELYEGVMEVKSIAGDNFLGGEDFTNLLAAHFIESNALKQMELDSKGSSALFKQAELCKYSLTNNYTGKMSIIHSDSFYEQEISRDDFEKLVNPLLLRLRQPIERALRDAKLSPGDLDAVILIGGATRMPIIRSTVTKMFGRLPYANINPDEAVALGAAIQAALKERNEALSEVILTDVCPYTLGTNVAKLVGSGYHESGYFLPIIERNSPIPVSRVERLYTIKDGQTAVHVEVYQGESRKVENNIKLGELNINVPPAPAGEQAIDVRYTYDINGILEVEVTTVNTGSKRRIVIEKSPGSMSEKEIEERLKVLQDLKIHPRDRTENMLILARGERMYEESLGEMRNYISELLQYFDSILSTQDNRRIKKAADEVRDKLDEIERRNGY
ncbi:MAG: molecular chaperone HscC [Bacillota bacterium]